jgi:hypothetical protein
MKNLFIKKGRIIKIKAGYNPNSSSIGTDLTPLLVIGGISSVVIPLLSFFIIRWIKKKKNK